MWFTECHSWELAFSFKLGSPSLRFWTSCSNWCPSCHQLVPASGFGQAVLTDIPHIINKSQPQILDKLFWLISLISTISPSLRFWTSCSDWYPSYHQEVPASGFGQAVVTDIPHMTGPLRQSRVSNATCAVMIFFNILTNSISTNHPVNQLCDLNYWKKSVK
jgi:hypothetical protein